MAAAAGVFVSENWFRWRALAAQATAAHTHTHNSITVRQRKVQRDLRRRSFSAPNSEARDQGLLY